MNSVAMSGDDTITINNRVFTNLADGDCIDLKYPNDIANVKTGKNQNSIYSFNATGAQCELDIRVLRGSDDDKFLLSLLVQQNSNFAGFPLMNGEFIKKMGDGTGKIASDTYVMGGGVFKKNPEAKSNVEGDTNQSVVIYSLKFSNAPRSIT